MRYHVSALIFSFFLGLFLVLCPSAFSQIGAIYVDNNPDVPGPRDGASWDRAYKTIQEAINNINASIAPIWVADGEYRENLHLGTLPGKDAITSSQKPQRFIVGYRLYSGFEGYGGAEETSLSQRNIPLNPAIINGIGPDAAVSLFNITNSRIDGFTITGGTGCFDYGPPFGGGIYYSQCNNTNLLANCIIRDNSASSGGGIYCGFSSPVILNCVLTENEAQGGSAIDCYQGSPSILFCTISQNYSEYGGAVNYGYGAHPVIRNTIFSHNSYSALREYDDTNTISLENCLFFNNDLAYEGPSGDLEDSEINELPGALDNLNADPAFANTETGDFHLTACSAALDAATTPGAPLIDRDENIRPRDIPGVGQDGLNTGYDIGAYELQPGTRLWVNPVKIDFGTFPVNQSGFEPLLVGLSNIGTQTIQFTDIATSDTDHFYFLESPDMSPLDPCQSRILEMYFDPSEPGPISSTLTILSNDSQRPVWEIPLYGVGINEAPIAGRHPQGSALDFDNMGAYLDCGNSNTLMPASAITVEAWICPWAGYDNPSDGGPVIAKDHHAGEEAGYILYIESQGRAIFKIRNSSEEWRMAISPRVLKASQWTHIAGVYDGNNVKVFVHGIEQDSVDDNAPTGIFAATSNFFVGGIPNSYSFPGVIDEVRCWNYARSQSQIRETMYKEIKGNEPGLAGYWRMDEGMGSLALDATANANHGKLKGYPLWEDELPSYAPVVEEETTFDVDIEDSEILLHLSGYDPEGDAFIATVTKLPSKGELYQYNEGSHGSLIDSVPTQVTDSGERRVFFVLPDEPVLDDTVDLQYKVADAQRESTNTATIHIRFVDRLISISPGSLDFNRVRIGLTPDPSQTVTIQNIGDSKISFIGSQVDLVQDDIPNFFIKNDTGEDHLDPGESRSVDIVFTPYSMGHKSAELRIYSDAFNEPEGEVEIDGYGDMAPVAGFHPTGSDLKFNGTDQYIQIPNNSAYNLGSPFTLEAWVKPDSLNFSYIRILSNRNADGQGGFSFGRFGDRLFLFLYDGFDYVTERSFLSSGNWTHVAVVLDDSYDARFYQNGSLMETVEGDAPGAKPSLADLRIGASATGSFQGWNGEIDEARIWNTIRTEEEIRRDMSLILTGSESGLVGYWNLDETSGAIAHDLSANQNHGALIGSPEWQIPSQAGVVDDDATMDVSNNEDMVILLDGYDMDGDAITATIEMIPSEGSLYQFDGGSRGDPINAIPTLVEDASLRVIFAPPPDPVLGASTELRFTMNDGISDSVNSATLHLVYVDRQITVSPDSLDFGIETIGEASGITQTVTISNDGVTTLSFTGVEKELSGGDAVHFEIFDDSGEPYLLQGQSRTIEILFDPQSGGDKSAALSIYSDDPISPVAQAPLSGHGNTRPFAGRYHERYALQFNGSDQFVKIPFNTALNLINNFTLEAWVKPGTDNSGIERVLSSRETYFGGGIGFGRYGSGLIFTTYGVNDYISSTGYLKANEWAHIAVSLDASNDASFFVNGQSAGVDNQTAPGQSTTRPLHIGACPVDPSQNWNGVIDELRIWNKVRSQTEIQNDMNLTLTGSESNLVAFWSFNEGHGIVLSDSSPNNLDGALFNSPLWVVSPQPSNSVVGEIKVTLYKDNDTTVTFCGYDADGDPLKAYITQLPVAGYGEVYQFAGSGPARGAKINSPDTLVTDAEMRIVFAPQDRGENYQTILRWKVFDDALYSNNLTTFTLTVSNIPLLTSEDILDHLLARSFIPTGRFNEADINQDGILDVADLVQFIIQDR